MTTQVYTHSNGNSTVPTAAIWWRVSTDAQDTSSDTQIADAQALAHREGYQVPPENIIGTDWHSLSVWESPAMNRLKALIFDRSIRAIFLYDADRAPSKPAHRLMFQALCADNNVAVRCVHGQVPDGDMSEVVQFLSAWSKENQVHRAQQGSRDGLRDRAKLRGLPTNGTTPLGYRFRYESHGGKKIPVALEPDVNHYVAVGIWRNALEGWTLERIAASIEIPPLRGGKVWYPSTVAKILKNPIYGGRYYALKQEAKTPGTRHKSGTYRKSSSPLPMESWVFLDFPIESPVVSWADWLLVQRKLQANEENARRNAKREYLLRGFLFCQEDGRRMVGHSHRGSYFYECPNRYGRFGVPNCKCPRIPGPDIEEKTWRWISRFLGSPQAFNAEMAHLNGNNGDQAAEIRDAMAACDRRLREVAQRETKLLNENLKGLWSDDALAGAAATLRAERTHHQDEIERQKASLAVIEESQMAQASLESLRGRMVGLLDSASPMERREILENCYTRVEIPPSGHPSISLGVAEHIYSAFADCLHLPHGQYGGAPSCS